MRKRQSLSTERSAGIYRTSANRKFGRYKGLTEKNIRRTDVLYDAKLDNLVNAWLEFYKITVTDPPPEIGHDGGLVFAGEIAELLLKDISYSQKSVEDFSMICGEVIAATPGSGHSIGHRYRLFVNTLIQQGCSSKYLIHTHNWPFPPHHLCQGNKKHVTINGDAGDACGLWNEKRGKIIINGNARGSLGNKMSGGTIVLNGTLTLYKDFDDSILTPGFGMKGGKIFLNGEIRLECDAFDYIKLIEKQAKRGKIYDKGKLIVDK